MSHQPAGMETEGVKFEAPSTVPSRVLVVDDDPTISDVVRRYLERAGFVVDTASDGPSALALADERPPDLVVLDLMLPGMSGLDVCRRLRRTSDVPIVMLTALGEEADRVVGFETGADDYVTKPFSPRELALRVQSVLRRASRTDNRRRERRHRWVGHGHRRMRRDPGVGPAAGLRRGVPRCRGAQPGPRPSPAGWRRTGPCHRSWPRRPARRRRLDGERRRRLPLHGPPARRRLLLQMTTFTTATRTSPGLQAW